MSTDDSRDAGTTPEPSATGPHEPDLETELETETESTMDTARPAGTPAEPHDTPPADTPRTAETTSTGATGDHTGPTRTATWPIDAPEPERGVRVGTVVWGLVIAAIGVGLIATVAGAQFDVELAVIGLVAAAGIALLVGSMVKGARRRG